MIALTPKLSRLLAGIVLALVFVHAAAPVSTNDLYWHVNTGLLLWETGGFPHVDPFSYTATEQTWYLHEWLTQALFAGVWQLGGMHALRLLTGVLAVLCLLAVGRLYRRELGAGAWVCCGMLVFLVLGASRLQARPTLFSILFLCGFVYQLTRPCVPCSRRWVVGVVLATLCWVNLHSVGLLAPVLYAAFVAGEAARAWLRGRVAGLHGEASFGHVGRHALTLALVTAATLAQPSGVALWGFAFQNKSEVMQFVSDEWAPFALAYGDNESLTVAAYVAILAILGIMLAIYMGTGIALSKARDRLRSAWLPDPTRVALLVLCLALGLTARRFHWILCLALALGLGWFLRRCPLSKLASAAWARAAAVAQLALIALLYHTDLRHIERPLHEVVARSSYYTEASCEPFQLGGVEFLAASGVSGNAFCHYGSGGIISYHLHPQIKVFIDSRIDLYRRGIYLDYLAIGRGRPDQNALLDRYATDLYYRHWDLAGLVDPTGWVLVYAGSDGDLWLRDNAQNQTNLERCARYWAQRGVSFSRATGLATTTIPRPG